MRTPLTIIRGEIESILQSQTLSAAVAEGLGSALEESDRMYHLIENLMTISRLEDGAESDNSIKYTASGGSVRLSVKAEDDMAVLTVADTGIGVPASCLPFIFDRFYRADQARSRESGGMGLGLSIVNQSARRTEVRFPLRAWEAQAPQSLLKCPRCVTAVIQGRVRYKCAIAHLSHLVGR